MAQITLDTDRIVRLLLRDAVATLGPRSHAEVLAVAANVEETARIQMEPTEAGQYWKASEGVTLAEAQRFFDREVVEHFQQNVLDQHWDTTWPTCPRHSNHPLWYSEERGAWCCPRDGAPMAPLGGLAAIRAPAT